MQCLERMGGVWTATGLFTALLALGLALGLWPAEGRASGALGSALGLALLGLGLLLARQGRRHAAALFAGATLLLGLALPWAPPAWQAQLLDALPQAAKRGAPHLAATFCLALAGLGLLLQVQARSARCIRCGQALALPVLALSFLALWSHAVGGMALERSLAPMGVLSALGLNLLGAALLVLRADRGWMALFASASAGGFVLRRLLPLTLLVLPLMFWLRLEAERAGWFGTEAGIGKMILATVGFLSLSFWWTAARLNRAEAMRRQAEAQVALFYDHAPAALATFDREMRYLAASRSWLEMFGLQGQALIGRSHYEVFPALSPELRSVHRRALAGEVLRSDEDAFHYPGRPLQWLRWETRPWYAEDGEIGGIVIFCEDVSARKRAEQERQQADETIRRLAYSDPVTQLPNRALLMDRVGQALTARQRPAAALLLLNLDRFKTLNDAHGRNVGDQVLAAVGTRLAGLLREGDTLARLGEDEFAVLLGELGEDAASAGQHALSAARKIQEGLRPAFALSGGDSLVLSAGMGIALLAHGESPEELLRRADTALHQAKARGGEQIAFFDPAMDRLARERFTIERELRRGIAEGELRLYLQSQVDVDGQVRAAEALVRWEHPLRGLLGPGAFIPIAEESNLIVELGAWVLEQACQLLAAARGDALQLSVNLSPRQFRQSGFVDWMAALLARSGADPTRLTLEVTEGLVIDDVADVVAKMQQLVALGLRFSIDDFGTGYSSLSYLKRMPIHELKIDQSFVKDAPFDANDAVLVETILAVATHLRLRVVAEGVESAAQADFLKARAQVVHQGYLYGRPEPAAAWLARWRPSCARIAETALG